MKVAAVVMTTVAGVVAGCSAPTPPAAAGSAAAAGSPSAVTSSTAIAARAGADWQLAEPSDSPLPRHSAGFAYDPARHQVLLSGGRTGCGGSQVDYTDTWAWLDSMWVQQHPANRGPAGLQHFTIAGDPATGQVIAVGIYAECGLDSAMFTWDGTDWTPSPASMALPPPMFNGVTAYDDASGQLILFGSPNYENGLPPPVPLPPSPQTWSWDGHAWKQLSPAHSPPDLADPAIAYDGSSRRLVLFGGQLGTGTDGPTPEQYIGSTWTWDGTTWAEASPATAPAPRAGAAMAYDAAMSRLVLFGGDDGTTYFGDTWTWDGTSWQSAHPAHSPAARSRAGMAYDPQSRRLVLFGGALSPSADSNETWLFGAG